MKQLTTCTESVTLSFEAIVLAAMIGAGVLAVTFAKQVDCQGKIDADWVNCRNLLSCPNKINTCWAGAEETPILDAGPPITE